MQLSFRSTKLLVVILFAWGLAGIDAFAVFTWVCRGKVTDASNGAPLANAEFLFKDLEMGREFKLKSKDNGEYMMRLPWGKYKLTVKMKGYQPQELMEVKPPDEGDELVENFNLAPGEGALASEMTKEEIEKIKKQQEEYEKYKQMSGQMKQLFTDAIEAKKNGQLDVAIEKLKQALELDPKQPNILGHLGDSYYLTNQYDLAVDCFTRAIAIAPLDATLHTNLGNVYVKKGMIAEAQAEFSKAIQTDPAHADINHYNVGVVMLNAGKSEEALQEFQKSVAANPAYAPPYYHMAMCLINKAQYADAVQAMEKYLQLAPTGEYAPMINQMLPELKKLVGK